jgi:hypothetical protein
MTSSRRLLAVLLSPLPSGNHMLHRNLACTGKILVQVDLLSVRELIFQRI